MARAVSAQLSQLPADGVLLLIAHYASEANIACVHALAAARPDVLDRNLLFAVLLQLLPETIEPERYVDLISDIGHDQLSELDDHDNVDISYLHDISAGKTRSRAKHLRATLSQGKRLDTIQDFIIARAHRIEEQTGLLTLIPSLVKPFLSQYPDLQTWYISNVLPLLRYQFEYYIDAEQQYTLGQIELADDDLAAELWLSRSSTHGGNEHGELARDLRGLAGPWIYGSTVRKRRRLESHSHDAPEQSTFVNNDQINSWRAMFGRLVVAARTDLPSIAKAVNTWNGPQDADLGVSGLVDPSTTGTSELLDCYKQTALACVYAAETSNNATVTSAWTITSAIHVLNGDDSASEGLEEVLAQLPQFSLRAHETDLPSVLLEHSALVHESNFLTAPGVESLTLAKFHVLSARILAQFGHPVSVTGAFKIKAHLDQDEQATLLQKMTHTLSTGRDRSDEEWHDVQRKMLWLRNWGNNEGAESGSGILGKIDRKLFEKNILEMLVHAGCNSVVVDLYLKEMSSTKLSSSEIEQVIASTALQFYDGASNGNRTRGAMKKASSIVTIYSKHFATSATFPRLQALIAATHAISSYSLTLQHGVPFTPVSIRVSSDPLSLIEKILSQNPGSYAKAQDLMSIGANLVAAGLTELANQDTTNGKPAISDASLERKKKRAQRRVLGMAIEAALHEDDFETAYSYVVNWLDTSTAAADAQNGNDHNDHDHDDEDIGDDIAWRAALAAGKHRSASHNVSNSASALRRLEQRMDLLSQALLLAPSHALPEILTAWRKCEEEMSSLLAAEAAEDDEATSADAQGIPGSFVEGGPFVQARREVGRGAAEEAPMGLFDVARGAAAAFSKSAFPLHGAAASRGGRAQGQQLKIIDHDAGAHEVDDAGQEHERVRKRDQLANAVTGGLASGIGWVLGANPVAQAE